MNRRILFIIGIAGCLTAAELPVSVSSKRKEILSALEKQEETLREFAAEWNRAFASAEEMSTSLNTTLSTFDALMKRFGVAEPRTNAAPDTNSPPFNILYYGRIAAQVGDITKDFNTLLTSENGGVPQITRLREKAVATGKRAVDRAFSLCIVLFLILLAASVLAGVFSHFHARKSARE